MYAFGQRLELSWIDIVAGKQDDTANHGMLQTADVVRIEFGAFNIQHYRTKCQIYLFTSRMSRSVSPNTFIANTSDIKLTPTAST